MKLVMIGDSTMQTNKRNCYPQFGWGQILPLFCKDNLKIINLGKNKLSTKTAFELGIFDKLLSNVEEGTYAILQFGHNDRIITAEERYVNIDTFKANLSRMIDLIEEKKGIVILMSPTYRMIYDNGGLRKNVLEKYPLAVKEIAEKKNVVFIDCYNIMYEKFKNLSYEDSKRYLMNFAPGVYENYPNGMNDDTHFRVDGAYEVCKIFCNEIKKQNCSLSKFLL